MAVTVQIFVPIADNAGKPFPDAPREAAAMLAEVAGGATIHGPAEGLWIDPRTGKEYADPVRIVEASATDSPTLRAVVREVALHVKAQLQQSAVMVRWLNSESEVY